MVCLIDCLMKCKLVINDKTKAVCDDTKQIFIRKSSVAGMKCVS